MRRALTYLGSRGQSEDLYRTFTSIVSKPVETDYTVDESKTIQLTDASITKAEKLLGVDNIHGSGIKYVHHETAVRAKRSLAAQRVCGARGRSGDSRRVYRELNRAAAGARGRIDYRIKEGVTVKKRAVPLLRLRTKTIFVYMTNSRVWHRQDLQRGFYKYTAWRLSKFRPISRLSAKTRMTLSSRRRREGVCRARAATLNQKANRCSSVQYLSKITNF